jgi:hypothetical protein
MKKNLLLIFITAASILFFTSCSKENFVEPIDPFEIKPLDPNAPQFQLGTGPGALKLKVNKENIVENSDSLLRIQGSLYVENSTYGDIRISNGDFQLRAKISKTTGGTYFDDLNGYALLNIPKEGFFRFLDISGMIGLPVSIKKGDEFDTGSFGWPVDANRYYFYYENPNPFPLNFSSSKFENVSKLALDPSDPYFFVSGDLDGTKLGDLGDVGMAFSAQGFIPFVPAVTTSEVPMDYFYGNMFLSGTFPILDFPISVSGESVIKFTSSNENNDANNFFDGKNSNFEMGINGKVIVNNEGLDWLGTEVVLGQATSELIMEDNGHTVIKMVGEREEPPMSVSDFLKLIIVKDYDFLDYLAPFDTKETFYMSMGSDVNDWMLGFKFNSKLNLPNNFSIDLGHMYLHVDPSQMKLDAMISIAGFSRIGFQGEVHTNGNFSLRGYSSAGFSASKGPLSIGFNLSISALLKYWDGTTTFRADGHLSGHVACHCWLFTVKASLSLDASISISSDGSFRVCFTIGIAGHGFDICISYNAHEAEIQGNNFHPEMDYVEIPIQQVPIQNRLPVEEIIYDR